MRPFQFSQAGTINAAIRVLQEHPSTRLLGGGTNLVDLMREGIEQPDRLVDIQKLPLDKIDMLPEGGVRIGATVRNTEIANHPLIRKNYALLAKALLSGASPQVRNMATAGGNLMQRTRCYYFMDPGFHSCNKRVPGSGCSALEGAHRIHAIFGGSEACIAVHPSDMCVALAALDAVVQVEGPRGHRSIPIHDFYRLPGNTPHIETELVADEIITSINLPKSPFGDRAEYLKVRDRRSFAFALVSCAAGIALEGSVIRDVRLVFGAVAPKPWRALRAERALIGKRMSVDAVSDAVDLEMQTAVPRAGNKYKVPLLKRTAMRALLAAGGVA
ncbi:xanthine dehydrogenase family protein subunit M [Acidobacteria bacterium AB60]|nr:xanthine dehydrogenase family protein subunit M [Acidobacteria bacterium AB60]